MSFVNTAMSEMEQAGLIIKDNFLKLNNEFQRISTIQNPKEKGGWYVGTEKMIAGKSFLIITFGNFHTGEKQTLKSWKENSIVSDHERSLLKKHMTEQKVVTDLAANKLASEVAETSLKHWNSLACEVAIPHGYLLAKGIIGYGVRYGENKKGRFVAIPLMDLSNQFRGMQRIYEQNIPKTNRNKEFDYGLNKRAGHFVLGELSDTGPILFAEGYATAASIFSATGYATVVCFDAGNLIHVIEAYRKRYPNRCFVICADDDAFSEKNVGLINANEAASAFKCKVVKPKFDQGAIDTKPTDFNDMHRLYGLDSIKAIVDRALNIEFPEATSRPCFNVYDDFFCVDGSVKKPGLYYHDIKDSGKGNLSLEDQWVCAPLHIDAISSDRLGNNFGRLIRFKNAKGDWCSWFLAMNLLATQSCERLFEQLLDKGLLLHPKNKTLLPHFLHTFRPKLNIETVQTTGWHDDSFVLPDKTFGDKNIRFQNDGLIPSLYQTSGTLEDWQNSIARYCKGNHCMILFVSAAFAGPLLGKANVMGGGIHLFGDSSSGKTTMLQVARSVWGSENVVRSWKATANGMEGAAALYSDTMLPLDEISEADPKEISGITYSLFNGQGKQRAQVSGRAKDIQRWRTIVLSTGEKSLEDHLSIHNQAINAGQELRLVSLSVASKFGVFDNLHEMPTGRHLSDALTIASKKFFGLAGQEFLSKLIAKNPNLLEEQEKFEQILGIDNLSSQVSRVAKRFALIALAGELATQYGITAWNAGMATEAAKSCFDKWRSGYSDQNIEHERILQSVSDYVDKYGDARFTNPADAMQCSNRAGYVRTKDGVKHFLFNKPGLQEAMIGHNFRRGLDVLQKAGWLIMEQKSPSTQVKIGGRNTRLYVIRFPDQRLPS